MKDAQGIDRVRCEIKQGADTGYVRIDGGIDWYQNNANGFLSAINSMKAAGIDKLMCYINSPGGSMFEANEIYNIIKSFSTEDKRYLEIGALCCSAATTIALAFSKANTTGYSNLTYMMHNPTTDMYGAEVKDLESGINLLTNMKEGYVKMMATRTGLSKTQISNKMDATWWLTAEQCLQYSLIGSIKDEQAPVPQDAAQIFNKFHFENVPAVLNKVIFKEVDQVEEEEEPIVQPSNDVSKIKTQMKNFVTLLMASMTAIKTYLKNENASEAEVVAALTQAFGEKETKITELTNSLKVSEDKVKELNTQVENHNKQMIKARLDLAQNVEKKITAEQRKVYEEQAPTLGYDGLDKILNALPARTSVKLQLEDPKNAGKKKEGEQEEREEPEYVEKENGARVYNSNKKNQGEVYARMVLAQAKASK
jgi:ATP-dependent Clp protease protease subunit